MYPINVVSDGATQNSNGSQQKSECLLCFNYITIDKTPLNNSHKLYKQCCKYLHSAISGKEKSKNYNSTGVSKTQSEDLPFCKKCSESAVELAELTEKLEYFQKNVSEFVLIFSLGILHRRGERKVPERKLAQFDISSLPDCNSCNISYIIPVDISPPLFTSTDGESESENVKCGDTDNYEEEDPLIVIMPQGRNCEERIRSSEEIKVENWDWAAEDLEVERQEDVIEHSTIKEEQEETQFLLCNNQLPNQKELQADSEQEITDRPSGEMSSKANWPWKVGRLKDKFQPDTIKISYPSVPVPIRPSHFPISSTTTSTASESISIPGPSYQSNFSSASKTLRDKIFGCRMCSKRFRRRTLLENHKKRAHDNEEIKGGSYDCPVCQKSFTQSSSMNRHLYTVHQKEKRYKCPSCSKTFGQSNDMKRHMTTHEPVKPYKCDMCDYSASRTNFLQIHKMRRHPHIVHFNPDPDNNI